MNPLLELGALLGVLYLSECVRTAGPFTVAVRSHLPGVFGAVRAWRPSQRGGRTFVFATPWPPLGTLYVADELPFVAGPSGVSFRPPRDEGWALPDAGWVHVPWAERARIRIDERTIRVDDRVVARLGSKRSAQAIASFLDRASASDPVRAIDALLEARHDLAAIRDRLAAFRRSARALRVATNGLLLSTLVAVTMLVTTLDVRRWTAAGVVLVVFWIATLVLAIRAGRTLPQGCRVDRVRRITQSLWPLGLVRALDDVSTEVAGDFDPLALEVVTTKQRAAASLRRWLRELAHPLVAETEAAPEVASDEAWFRKRIEQHVRALAKELSIAPEVDVAPKWDGGSEAWCPRCHEQYARAGEDCLRCRGVRLVRFERKRVAAAST